MAENPTSTTSTSRVKGVFGRRKKTQLEVLQLLVTKHLTDPSLVDLANKEDFAITSTERGISRYENTHLVAALDTLLAYQRDRRAKALGGLANMRRSYTHDPRTRLIELLKRWLRTNAPNRDILEEEVHRVCSLCRDILNHPNLFPSRNARSFMQTLAEVYQHLQVQLRDVLERDRTCAELAVRCLSLSRNLIADAVIFLLLAVTDLAKTDKLPSVEVVALWQSLPNEANPLPSRADVALQKLMKDSWQTACGSLIAKLLSMTPTFRLFDDAGAEMEAKATAEDRIASQSAAPQQETALSITPSADSMAAFVAQVREELEKDALKSTCGFAGPFREPKLKGMRKTYVAAAEAVFHLLYLLGEVLVQFQRISDGMGDYGMIRVAPWLHPFLDAIVDKVLQLKNHLGALNASVDAELVLAKARGQKVKKPIPTELQLTRAHGAIERAVTARECHAALLTKAIEDLRARSAPERLPHVVEGVHDACLQLEHVFASPQFRECVGDAFPDLPALAEMARSQANALDARSAADGSMLALEGAYSDEEDEEQERSWWPMSGGWSGRRSSVDSDGSGTPAAAGVAEQSGSGEGRSNSLRRRAYNKVVRKLSRGPSSRLNQEVAVSGRFPPDDPDLPRDGWICHHGANGRIFWHHKSLGPAPWECQSWEGSVVCSPRSQPSDASTPARPPRPRSPRGEQQRRSLPAAPSWLDQDDCNSPQSQSSAPPRPRRKDESVEAQAATDAAALGRPTVDELSAPLPQGAASTPSSLGAPVTGIAPLDVFPASPVAAASAAATSDTNSAMDTPCALPLTPSAAGDMHAEVYRLLLQSRGGWKRHDHRMLLLQGDRLHVFEKGSMDQVKLSVDLGRDVDEVSMIGSGILSIQLQRRRPSSAMRAALGVAASAEPEQKVYIFEFVRQSSAAAFQEEIAKRREGARRRGPEPQMSV